MIDRRIKILLACCIASSVLYFAGDVLMSVRYAGYSYLHQTVSELNALGAPIRGLSIAFGLAGYGLLIPFGLGIWRSAAGNRRLRVVGGVLAGLVPLDPGQRRSPLCSCAELSKKGHTAFRG